MRLLPIVLVLILALAATATAQQSRYSTWSNPDGTAAGSGDLQGFIEKLNKLIDEAEKARAADPVFLQDLRNLANGATDPYRTTVIDDAFTDGNFTANPEWQVLSGAYFIESGWGLRNKLIQQQQTANQGSGGDDIAKVLLGQILKQAAGVKDTAAPTENIIATRAAISNAFSISAEISSWVADGRFEIGVFQGQNATVGYRLLYASGKGLQLHRVGSKGSSVVDTSTDTLALEDKEFHAIQWTRGSDGKMTVSVDGKEMLSVVDRGFSDPFDGLRLSNTAGDFIVKKVTVKGL